MLVGFVAVLAAACSAVGLFLAWLCSSASPMRTAGRMLNAAGLAIALLVLLVAMLASAATATNQMNDLQDLLRNLQGMQGLQF